MSEALENLRRLSEEGPSSKAEASVIEAVKNYYMGKDGAIFQDSVSVEYRGKEMDPVPTEVKVTPTKFKEMERGDDYVGYMLNATVELRWSWAPDVVISGEVEARALLDNEEAPADLEDTDSTFFANQDTEEEGIVFTLKRKLGARGRKGPQ